MAKIKIEPFIEGELAKYCQNLRNEPVYLVLKRLTSNLWWDKIALDLNWLSPDKQKIWILHCRLWESRRHRIGAWFGPGPGVYP